MKRALALLLVVGAAACVVASRAASASPPAVVAQIAPAVPVTIQQAESTTAVWANAQLHNDFDGGAHVDMQGVVKQPDGGGVNVSVVSVTCQGPATFSLITTCFQAWKDANGLP